MSAEGHVAAPRIAEKLPRLPRGCGVYVFYDRLGKAVYVGKATDLRARVRSYFGRSSDERLFHRLLVKAATDVDVLVTASDKEALILENTLIKRHRPRYNIMLRDDKTYASVAVTLAEEVPRLVKIRRRRPGGAAIFGPFTSGSSLNATLKVLRAAGGIRTCTDADYRTRSRPCLEHEIGNCAAPCVRLQSVADYRRGVEAVLQFFRGRTGAIVARCTERMHTAAAREHFEEAARWRDRVTALERTAERQHVVDPKGGNRDVLGWCRDGQRVTVAVLQVREGTLCATRRFGFASDAPDPELAAAVLGQLYAGDEAPPAEVLVPAAPEGAATLVEWLAERRGGRVAIRSPRRGKGRELLRLAAENARAEAARSNARAGARAAELQALAEALGLDGAPRRLECVDISHLGGAGTVGSCVTFLDGEPSPRDYLRFKLRGVAGGDDPAAIREVVARRLKRGLSREDLPDLLLVDGGRAQLGAAVAAAVEAGLAGRLPLASLVKDEGLHTKGDTGERLLAPGAEAPIEVAVGSPVRHLLQRLRDEAHRFALAYQQELRAATTLRSGLEDVPGIGPARRKALLARFGSVDGLRAASEAEIRATPGVGRKAADALLAFLRGGG